MIVNGKEGETLDTKKLSDIKELIVLKANELRSLCKDNNLDLFMTINLNKIIIDGNSKYKNCDQVIAVTNIGSDDIYKFISMIDSGVKSITEDKCCVSLNKKLYDN